MERLEINIQKSEHFSVYYQLLSLSLQYDKI